MKKVFLFLALVITAMSMQAFAGDGLVTVTKTVAQLKGEQSWSHGSDYTNIAVDDAITIDHGKYYTDNSGQLRYYYQNNTYASKFTVSAKKGVMIKSITFKYSAATDGVLSDTCCHGKVVPENHRFYSETAKEVNTDSITFYSSMKSGTAGGNLNILSVTVSYFYPVSPELQFAQASKSVCKNAAAFVNPLQNKGNGAVTYESSNLGVAMIASDGTITVNGVGNATISAFSAETSLFFADTATFELAVSSNLTPSPLAPVDITEIKMVNDFKVQDGNNWTDASLHLDVDMNDALKLLGSGGNQKYVSSKAFRFYQWSNQGQFTIQGKSGITIKNVAFVYTKNTNSVISKRYGTDGKNIPETDRLESNTTYDVNANSISYFTGNPSGDKGYVDIEKYTVVYTDPTIAMERFAEYPTAGGSSRIIGDNGIYKWNINAQNRTQTVGAYSNCIKLEYADTIASDGVMEGGIKSVAFDWRTTGGNYPIHFIVTAGSVVDDITMPTFNNTARILTYSHDYNITSNTTLSIINPVKEESAQNHIAVGPVRITPYLLFVVPNHADTFNMEDGTTCDLNSALINNTGAAPIFSIIENTAGGNPILTDGVLDFSSIVRTGDIKIQAAWEDVTTTLTLTINLQNPGISFAKTADTTTISVTTYQQILNPGSSSGAVTYSLVSAPQGATIDADGTVHFSIAGEYIVKGKIAAAVPFAEDSTTYTLIVNRAKPEISFAQDTITKTVIDEPFIILPATPVGVGDTTFTSSDPAVATVDALTGEVTIVAKGETTIKAEIAQNGVYEAANASYLLIVEGQSTKLNDLHNDNQLRKVVVDGELRIYRGENCYSILGTTIR